MSLTNQDKYSIIIIELRKGGEGMDLLEIIEKVTAIILNVLMLLEIKKKR